MGVVDHTQVSMVNDTPHGEDGVYFNTTNEDRAQTTTVPMLEVNDLISLPKGQAFVLVNGVELALRTREVYKLFERKINNDRLFIEALLKKFNLVRNYYHQNEEKALRLLGLPTTLDKNITDLFPCYWKPKHITSI